MAALVWFSHIVLVVVLVAAALAPKLGCALALLYEILILCCSLLLFVLFLACPIPSTWRRVGR